MRKIIYTLLVVIMVMPSCREQKNEVDAQSLTNGPQRVPHIGIEEMPYTNSQELYNLYIHSENNNVIHYNIARLLAETELIAGANQALGDAINPYDE